MMAQLPDGGRVAVISYQGSFCPITLAHVGCPIEARNILLGLPTSVARPAKLETFHAVVGFVNCNADSFVSSKLSKKVPPVPIIPYNDRMMLIDMATKEYDWLWAHNNPRGALHDLTKAYPKLLFVPCNLCGADDAIKYQKWKGVTPMRRVICLGRPADPGLDNGTEGVRKRMAADGVDADAGLFVLGPELPDISSSAVRKAFVENDLVKLRECLHPSVMEWNLNAGPYAPKSENTPASRPLGEFVFQRKKTAPITHVRSIPTDSRDAHVFFWNMAVTNGDLVRLLDIDDSARFGYIEFDKGEGWVKLEYLHCVGESTQAVHRREDDAGGTPLRTEPVEAHRWVKGAEALHNGDVATLLRPDNRSQWSFFLVRFKGHDGWLKLRNMSFGVSGFVGVKRNPRAIKVLKINGDEVRRGGGKGKGKVKGKFGKKGKGK